MSEDYKDKIQEIRSRRQSSYQAPSQVGPAYDPSTTVGVGKALETTNISPSQQETPVKPLFDKDFVSPWLRDRVHLSLEGQIAMMELRSTSRAGMADLGYTNRIPILPIRSGIFVKVEPPGTYRLCYHYR